MFLYTVHICPCILYTKAGRVKQIDLKLPRWLSHEICGCQHRTRPPLKRVTGRSPWRTTTAFWQQFPAFLHLRSLRQRQRSPGRAPRHPRQQLTRPPSRCAPPGVRIPFLLLCVLRNNSPLSQLGRLSLCTSPLRLSKSLRKSLSESRTKSLRKSFMAVAAALSAPHLPSALRWLPLPNTCPLLVRASGGIRS